MKVLLFGSITKPELFMKDSDIDKDVANISRELGILKPKLERLVTDKDPVNHYNLIPQRLKELAERGSIICDAFLKDIETFKATLPEF